jgi:hypothetical protein
MKAFATKINTYKTGVNIVNNYNLEKRILNILLIMFGALALCYVVFIGSTVFNIVERQSLSKESRTLSNEVSSLELEYLSISNKVDLALATSLGFKESSEKQYTTRKALGSIKLAKNEL